jgi:Ca-activated chloride channel family protein
VGLVAFAGNAFLQTPITLDYGAFHESLSALDTHIIPRPGTNITSAIRETRAALQRRPGSDKIMILVTDGEDLEGDSIAAAKAAAAEDGLKIFTVGVGSPNGDLIPLPADQGGGFLKDKEGRLVKSRLDESALKALAAATGGSYAPLGTDNQGLDAIYQQAIAPLAKHDLESRAQKIYTERFQWPLCASLVLLLTSTLVRTRRRLASTRPLGRFANPTAATLVVLCWLVPIHFARASPASAAAAYQHGDFSTAEHDYAAAAERNPKQPILHFNAGTAAYKAGEFPQAAKAFEASVNAIQSGDAKRLAEQEDAYYNLGNTLYRVGQKTEKEKPEETIQSWTQAVKAYDAALQLRADDADDKFNRDLVSRKLEALKKAQSQKTPEQQARSQQNQPQSPSKEQSKSADQQPQQANGQQQAKGQPQSGDQAPQQAKGQPQSGDQAPQQANGQPQTGDQLPQKQAKREHNAENGQSQQASGQPQPGDQPPQQANGQAQRTPPTSEAHAQGSGSPDSPSLKSAEAGDDRRVPGEMSRQEARELLDSVSGEERRPPLAPMARNDTDVSTADEPDKNW